MPQQINLIDAGLLPQRQRLPATTVLAVVASALTLVLAHFAWERVALARALAPLAQGEAAPPADPGDAGTATGLLTAEQLARGEALRDLLRQQPTVPDGAAQLMEQIVQALPDALWLTELELGAARAVRISGGATDAASFGQFTTRLSSIALLQGVPIGTVRLEPHSAAAADTAADASAGSEAGAKAQLFVLASAVAAAAPGAADAVSPKALP